ncbi:hypothetical protein GIS00_04720 [Nakamurella sp. YIM 132087]|uniref:LamG-like jellyroll fold domain-containing protein n=1 Tax=Nakamurella alba TaxID=2665158 RepID=A0A7K1FGR0_9ACTN|nr:hypothetical protein [Nakamurella alba]
MARRRFLQAGAALAAGGAVLPLVPTAAGAATTPVPTTPVPAPTAPGAPAAAGRAAPKLSARALKDVQLLDSRYRQNMRRTAAYLAFVDPDRMLHTFRTNVGLPSTAEPCGGWEAPDVQLRGHSMGHLLSGLALSAGNTGDAALIAKSRYLVSSLAECQAASPAAGFTPGYLSAFGEQAFVDIENGRNVWAPYYTIHKILAGMIDQYLHLGNEQALEVARGIASWVDARTSVLPRPQLQTMLKIEFGGMNESLADLYAITADPLHLTLAQRFDEDVLFDPLAARTDTLAGRHANTDLAKIVGAAAEWEMTGEARYRTIATYFWDQVVRHHSYVIGGNSNAEFFGEPDQVASFLGENSCENCNTYNMIKLSRRLFLMDPSRTEYVDYIEWSLLNQMLGEQDPDSAHGFVTYYTGLASTARRKVKEGLEAAPGSYSSDYDNFSCDHGTAMETHSKFADSVWFTQPGIAWLNLFVPSEFDWTEQGVRLRVDTAFPTNGRITVTVTGSGRFAVKVRIPAWVSRKRSVGLTVNGRSTGIRVTPGSYATVDRQWRSGDRIGLDLPMDIAWLPAPDNAAVQAVAYGPLVLAGRFGDNPTPAIPVVAPTSLRRASGNDFTLSVAGRSVRLSPFMDVHHENYQVYWCVPPRSSAPKVVAAYGFDEADGPAKEAKGRAGAAILRPGATRTAGRSGGRAVVMDGVAGHVELPAGLPKGLSELTVSVWARVDTIANSARVFDLGFNVNSYFFLTPRTGLNKARAALKLSGMEAEDFIDAAVALPQGAWTHVAVTLGKDGGKFYVDGVLSGSNPALQMSPLLIGATQHNYLGRSQNRKHPYLHGAVDDFRLFGVALGAKDIAALHAGTFTRYR